LVALHLPVQRVAALFLHPETLTTGPDTDVALQPARTASSGLLRAKTTSFG